MHLAVHRVSATLFLSTTALFTVGAVFLQSGNAQAACAFSPTAGGDVFICDSGIFFMSGGIIHRNLVTDGRGDVDITEKASLFATADYTTNLGGERTRSWEGNIGLNVKW